ncbi:hypothetical protein ABFS82_04G043600 [Erythranthe guttata]|uniref:CRIB domain-containing protein n=1 Tax=Erythranthe guttata TaxID=4155 RepID=A0A022S2G7_ERYGU|nr:PREDICTED: CRIB domain-containing protein RIC7-like [Erythranthe guttata]EYU46426.1 hypothetical protein MIMGU_mgv1a012695mg [Erythranthe guttata]|eukprot:XP_012831060.1 PREDICTED: CRIB domain-containing protein RIC7-like [Erythranthe guttata]
MSTKMKGLIKGFRYISQIFEEEKEDDMQIGFPTDVKHVAHIGWDGPSSTVQHEAPSWMKEFKSPSACQSAPLSSPTDNRGGDPEIKWVSEDSRRSNRVTDSPGRDCPADLPKSSRRHHSSDSNPNDSPRKKDSSTRSRHSRRNHSKDSAEGSVKSNRQHHMQETGADSPSRGLPPDAAKKTRRKKSKESENGGGGSSRSSTRSRPPSNSTENDNNCDPSSSAAAQITVPVQSANDVDPKKIEF